MTDLPNDVDDWPSDSYALLGVAPGIDAKELRRRYTQLIRRFKPEQYPEQFRRIREAYDQVLVQEQWRRYLPPPPFSDPPPIDPDSREAPGSDEPMWTAPPPRRTFESELDRLWTLANAGMVDEAYRGLRELEREQPGSRDLAIRRYWLVTAFRELEPAGDPLERALRTILDEPGHSPLWAEVRLRGQLTPGWAFEAFFDEMLEAARSPMPLAILYDIRWLAAIQIGSWRLLLEDVQAARRRFREHPSEWARMLLQVVDRIAWIGEPSAARACEELVVEIERSAKGDRALDFELDRLDFLRELVPQWLDARPKSPLESALCEFVAATWRGRWETVRSRIFELSLQLMANVTHSIRTLDVWAKSHSLIFAQVVRTVNDNHHLSRSRPVTPDEIRGAFDGYLAATSGEGSRSRASLVQFFRDELILPEELLHAIDRRGMPATASATLDQIEADWVVRLLARAACCTAT